MLTVDLRLLEFLDSAPLPDCTVRFTAHVVAGWLTRETLDDGSDVRRAPGGGTTTTVLEYDHARAEDVIAEAITDAQGRAALSLSLNRAFTDVRGLRRDGKPPDAVEAQLSAGVDVHGLGLPAAYRFESLPDPSSDLKLVLVADLARSIVGDTSATQTSLWFQLHAAPAAGDRLVCVLASAALPSERRVALTFDPQRALTATAIVAGLAPGTAYTYELRLVKPAGPEYVLTRGQVRTIAANPQRLTMAFASCHLPDQPASLNRWHALAARDDIDLAFLIGDQIYGDGIERIFPTLTWAERYERRYTQLWTYQPVRDVMRSRPMYMALDDHEVVDDWGTVPIDATREAAGVRGYRIFQHAHNPGGFAAPVFDYSFRRGPAAFYVTDSRTARGKDSAFPVMGRAQYDRMKAWAASPAVRDADLVFVIVPVPPAMLPIAQLEELASVLAPVVGAAGGSLLGAIVGAVVGFVAGGPAGAIGGAAAGAEIGAFVGAIGTSAYYEHVEDTITEPDIRDAWTYDKNLPDLVRLFDLLFDVANDIGPDGRPGARPKGVFLLCGDYHFGAIHQVRSTRTGGGHDHRNNPVMMQVTSSPISKPAIDADKLLLAASVVSSKGEFKLDDDFYRARFVGHIEQRNFGRMSFERIGTSGRRYRIQIYVEGVTDALAQLFELDLDARPVRMKNLIGELLGARGRLTLLRVHDPRSGFGPATDRIDGEVVIALDSEPGRAFGFQLRADANLPVRRRMLALLRDAFAQDRPVAIDYLRTGELNGTIIRIADLPAAPRSRAAQRSLLMERV